MTPEFHFSIDQMAMHNPLVRYLIEEIWRVQAENELMFKAFFEYA